VLIHLEKDLDLRGNAIVVVQRPKKIVKIRKILFKARNPKQMKNPSKK
jgi:hypothetical protein